MRTAPLMLAALLLLLAPPALAQTGQLTPAPALLPPYQTNTYGPGINSDSTGRPFTWQPQTPQAVPIMPAPTLNIRPDVYGPGVGSDQYGRPVTGRSWPR
jgi:hypothetical protein